MNAGGETSCLESQETEPIFLLNGCPFERTMREGNFPMKTGGAKHIVCLDQEAFLPQKGKTLVRTQAPFREQVLLRYLQEQVVHHRMIDSTRGGTSLTFLIIQHL